jgi:hypothetical protein
VDEIAHTPSSTSSEINLLNGAKKPKSLSTKLSEMFYLSGCFQLAYVAATEFAAALLIVVAVIVVIEAFHDQIVNGLKPITRWLRG